MNTPSVLVIHALHAGMRNTTFDFAGSFGRHLTGVTVEYINIFGVHASDQLEAKYDLAILTTDLLGLRSAPCWPDIRKRLKRLTSNIPKIVMFPQDDYTYSSRLDELAVALKVDQIWSPISQDLDLLYPKSRKNKIQFFKVLTGYIESNLRERYEEFSKPLIERTIDIGQRVRFLPAQFGQLGNRKAEIAVKFAEVAKSRGLRVDVSTHESDTLYGDDWLRFLGNSRFTISRKGGASLADSRNSFAFSLMHLNSLVPKASDRVKEFLACKFGLRSGRFTAESPRLFEAAALGVVQILEEDTYLDGQLAPWVHYIPLKSDFSNLDEVFSCMADLAKSSSFASAAKRELIESGKYSYASFIAHFQKSVGLQISNRGRSVVDLDSDLPSLSSRINETVSHFQKPNYFALPFRFGKSKYPAFYITLTKFETIPETLFQPWVPISTKLKF